MSYMNWKHFLIGIMSFFNITAFINGDAIGKSSASRVKAHWFFSFHSQINGDVCLRHVAVFSVTKWRFYIDHDLCISLLIYSLPSLLLPHLLRLPYLLHLLLSITSFIAFIIFLIQILLSRDQGLDRRYLAEPLRFLRSVQGYKTELALKRISSSWGRRACDFISK